MLTNQSTVDLELYLARFIPREVARDVLQAYPVEDRYSLDTDAFAQSYMQATTNTSPTAKTARVLVGLGIMAASAFASKMHQPDIVHHAYAGLLSAAGLLTGGALALAPWEKNKEERVQTLLENDLPYCIEDEDVFSRHKTREEINTFSTPYGLHTLLFEKSESPIVPARALTYEHRREDQSNPMKHTLVNSTYTWLTADVSLKPLVASAPTHLRGGLLRVANEMRALNSVPEYQGQGNLVFA